MATTILSQVVEFSTQLVLRGLECPPQNTPHHYTIATSLKIWILDGFIL